MKNDAAMGWATYLMTWRAFCWEVLFNKGTNCFWYFLFRCIACNLSRQNTQNKSSMHSKGESISAKKNLTIHVSKEKLHLKIWDWRSKRNIGCSSTKLTLTYVYELKQPMTSCFVQSQLDQGLLLFYAFEWICNHCSLSQGLQRASVHNTKNVII